MMAGQNSAGQVVKARVAVLAPVALTMPLGVIMAVADDRRSTTGRATDAVRPPMLPDQFVAFGVVDQSRQINQRRRRHDEFRSGGNRRHRIISSAGKESHFRNSM